MRRTRTCMFKLLHVIMNSVKLVTLFKKNDIGSGKEKNNQYLHSIQIAYVYLLHMLHNWLPPVAKV